LKRASSARISGTGSYLPSKVLTNHDLERMVDTSDEWITERTGIKERRVTTEDQAASDLAYEAAVHALDDAGIDAIDLDAILVATVCSDYLFPTTSCIVQERIGAKRAFAYDFAAACSGFVFGMGQVRALIESGMCKRVLLIGVETLTKLTDWTDRNTCVLFGDGAGAAIFEPGEPGEGLLSVILHSDGALSDIITLPAGGSRTPLTAELLAERENKIHMRGNETFKVAVKAMESAMLEVIEETGITQDQIDLLIPHQANIRIIQALAKRIEVPDDRLYLNLDRYGNTSAATIPIAIDEARRSGRIGPGSIVVTTAFGSGVTWGAAVIRL
jgi:3-oxoacyl-[acyl-carrier-protein] synthase III